MDPLGTLLAISLDLNAALSTADRYQRLLKAVRRVVPYDASALLRLKGGVLLPVAATGLTADALGRRYPLAEHPRLELISRSSEPVFFAADSELPDPFDGLLAEDARALTRVHACLGCPLWVEDELVGVLTADALAPHAFDDLDRRFLAALGALAAAAMRTSELIEALEQSVERHGLVARDLMRSERLRGGTEILGASGAIDHLREEIGLVGQSDFAVLITGETGTGKELVARAVHAASARRDQPLIHLNCSALPESLVESELFGHRKGAFTGATEDRAGKFEIADRGTLFLDEIGELPSSVQPKLLRALQSGEIQRVGSDRPRTVDVRIIAATNRALEREVEAGRFRSDLFHRLNVYPLHVPPLRERAEDIPLLAGRFSDVTRRRLGIGPVRFTPEALAALRRYSWPGNIRELENVVSRVTLRGSGQVPRGEPVVLAAEDLLPTLTEPPDSQRFEAWSSPLEAAVGDAEPPRLGKPFREAVDDYRRSLIRRAVADAGGNWSAAARSLGLHRSNLHHLAGRLGMK